MPVTDVRISSSTDDAEERNSGSVKLSSSDLEMADDGPTKPGQTIGLRFNGLDIPQGATITNAYVQFQADEADTGAATLQIQGQDTDSAAAFADVGFDVSSRQATSTSVTWTPPDWTTVGAAGVDQQTADISAIIQEIVSRPGWTPMNSIALMISGNGQRTAESYDGSAAAAPLLHIEYEIVPLSDPVVFEVPADSDVAVNQINEAAVAGTSVGITASATDPDVGDSVTYSIDDVRFDIDAAGVVTRSGTGTLDFETESSITVNVTATSSDFSTATEAFTLGVLDDQEAVVFDTPPDSDPAPNEVAELAAAGTQVGITALADDPDTGDTVVSYSVDDPRFDIDANGIITRTGTGTLNSGTEPTVTFNVTATSSDLSTATQAFTLDIYDGQTPTIVESQVSTGTDDAEERSDGVVKTTSRDIEMVDDTTSDSTQTIGIRFNGLDIPNGATITNAHIQFWVAEADVGAVTLEIHGEDTDNAETFSVANFDVSSRQMTSASATWSPPEWTTFQDAGADQQTTDISAIIQEIVDRPGWNPTNSIALVITGTNPNNERSAITYDGDTRDGGNGSTAPLLHIEYQSGPATGPVAFDNPADTDSSANHISEVALAGTTVGITAAATDPDAGDTVSYSVDDTRFDIDAAGVITRSGSGALDAGTEPVVTLTVTATSSDLSTATEAFVLNVADPNQLPVAFDVPADADSNANEILELAAAGALVGITAAATDPNAGDSITYSVDDARFEIDAGGVITRSTTGTLDFETEPAINLTVTATSSDLSTATEAFSLTVSDEFEPENTVVESRISSGADDAEERNSGSVKLSSSDLEMADDGASRPNQTIGLRFNDLDIQQGAIITKAYIQFQADEVDTGIATLQIHGEDTDSAAAFVDSAFDVSSRQSTAATVDWTPPDWTTTGAAGVDQQSADISSIIQEIVNRPGWTPTNSVALMITGSGERTAESFNGNASAAPLLHIEFQPPGPPSDPVVFNVPADIDSAADQLGELAAAGTAVGITALAADPDAGDTVSYSIDDARFAIDANGIITRSGLGTLDFETEPSVNVTVTATSSDFSTDTQIFTISVDDDNELPVANNDSATTQIDLPIVIDVLANDDLGDGLSDISSGSASSQGGGVVNHGDGTFSYTPPAAFTGADSFNYTITDSNGSETSTATVALTVNAVPSQPPSSVTLQQTISTGENGAWWPSSYSSDPAGIVYIAHNPYQSMLISDSEINEMSIYDNKNLFFFDQNGDLNETATTDPAFSDEPTGITYNPNNLHLYFSDDTSAGNGKRIYDVDPGSDGLYFTSDDPAVTSFRTSDFGSSDPEGLAYDTTRDVLYVLDGVTDQLFTVDPGLDGSFVNDADNVVSSFDTSNLGVVDPEGIAYDEVFDLLYVIGRKSDDIVHQVDPVTGTLVGEIDISGADVKSGAGLAIGPSSVPGQTSLWIADRGVDNDSDPNENDGRVFEFTFDLV